MCKLFTREMRKLEKLTLDGIKLDGSQLVMIGERLPWLKKLSLDGWTNENLEHLFAGLPNLEELHLGNPLRGISDGEHVSTELECLGSLKKLRRLYLWCKEGMTSKVEIRSDTASYLNLSH